MSKKFKVPANDFVLLLLVLRVLRYSRACEVNILNMSNIPQTAVWGPFYKQRLAKEVQC